LQNPHFTNNRPVPSRAVGGFGAVFKLPLRPMSQFVVKTLLRTGLACPSMWEGELSDGRHVYVRYRGGTLSIEVGSSRADATSFLEKQIGHKRDGWFELEQLRKATQGVIDWPDTYKDAPAEFYEIDAIALGSAAFEKMAIDCEERAKIQSEPTATQLREEGARCRKEVEALKKRRTL
jgi:hypothetical protein